MNVKGKILQLYTTEYPYGKTESFLENEVPVLAKKFEKIYVHPLLSKKGEPRELPANVEVLEALNNRTDINTRSLFLKNLFLLFHILFTEWLHCPNKLFFIKKLRDFNSLAIRAIYDSTKILASLKEDNKNPVFYSYWMNDWALALAILKHQGKIDRFVFRCGGFDIYDERHEGNYLPFRYFIYKHTRAVYPNSKDGVNYIKKKNVFPEKIHIQYWGTNDHGLSRFDGDSKFTIVSCSNMIPLKRVHLIIEILKQVNIELNWVHFGDGECMEDLKKRAFELPSNIQYEFKGRVPNKEVNAFYIANSVNLFITTSETESLPVSIQEAISFGIPIIATNVGGIAEIVTEETGYLIDKNFEIKHVAQLINEFKISTKNTLEYRKNVREFWKKHFEAENNYSRFAEQILTKE